ncbi:ABC transporter substrate-binding protein [Subtercola frigoramans]|uniref:Peptide/nickel transport system substrate-binding protein n=1 Tax=Subtercola frigoramans TaxID=120298 RepID=A0ABS2L8X0_9MICO|nr:ABC transporter substrate-binding protein [Subtercola frigoramans]MBM7473469.1 peptide/nickel transport system substrate-binding protein [Subtercola frigoramans]
MNSTTQPLAEAPPTEAKRRWSRVVATLTALAVVPVLLAACAGGAPSASNSTGAPKAGGTMKVGSPSPNAAPDPVTMYDPGSINVVQQVAEYLVWSENDGTLSPMLATSWDSSADAATWTVTLRDGVTFNNGSPLTATDVVASIDRLIAPDSVSSAASSFAGILTVGHTVATDAKTVTFTLDRPFADFPYLISSANYNTVILPADYDGDFLHNPVGTGPFTLTSYDPNTGAVYAKNPSYWDASKVYLDGVTMTFFTDYTALSSALLSRSIDVAALVSYSANQPLYSSDQVVLQSTNAVGGTFLAMRTDTAPWDDVRVRQALALTIDREALKQALQGGQGVIANDHIFADLYGQNVTVPQRDKNIDEAKSLLAAAGHAGGLTATLSAPQSAAAMAQLIQQMAAEAGFTLTLDLQDDATYYNAPWLEVPLGLTGWASRPTASQFLSLAFTSDAIWNTAHWSNAEFDGLVAQYEATVDKTARAALAQQIATLMHDQVPQIIATWPENAIATLPDVHGVPVSASAYTELAHAWLDR